MDDLVELQQSWQRRGSAEEVEDGGTPGTDELPQDDGGNGEDEDDGGEFDAGTCHGGVGLVGSFGARTEEEEEEEEMNISVD